jgi:hypothetical protein
MAYPKIKHNRVLHHPILGEVKVYEMKNVPMANGSGCQSDFFLNGAKVNNPKQYALKMFKTSIEALAAYQRQKIAAEHGYAPPVGKMVLWVITKNGSRSRNRWGYETCIADVSYHARMKAMILGSPKIRENYNSFCEEDSLSPILDEVSICLFWDEVDEKWDIYEYGSGCALDDVRDRESLKYKIMDLDITDTQYDDVSDAYDNEKTEWNQNLRLGVKWKDIPCSEDDAPYMFNDLHCGNIGLWKDNPVVIDFGYHIACPMYRNFENMVTLND